MGKLTNLNPPAVIKSKVVTGVTLGTRTGSATVFHGLVLSKILGFSAMIELYPGSWFPFGELDVPTEYIYTFLSGTAFSINCGYTTTSPVLNKPFRIVVFYID
jgi:hypothetical protein